MLVGVLQLCLGVVQNPITNPWWLNTCGCAWHDSRPGAQVAFLAGCLYTLVGVLRLGWLTNFLSHSVISGFMTGASVIIGLSQARCTFMPPLLKSPACHESCSCAFARHAIMRRDCQVPALPLL